VHEASTGRRAAEKICPDEGLRSARFTPDGQRVLMGTRGDRALLLDWHSDSVLARSQSAGDHIDEICWLPDGTRFVAATRSNQVAVHDGETLEVLHSLLPSDDEGPDREVYEPFAGMALSPPGRDGSAARVFLASGLRVRCLDTDDGDLLWEAVLKQPAGCPTVSPDGSRLAVSSERGVTLLDAATGVVVATASCFRYRGVRFPGLPGGVGFSLRLAFSPDGQRLAASTPNGQLLLLDPVTLDLLREYPRQDGLAWIEDLTWFADSCRLLVGCAHNRVLVWSVVQDRCLLESPLSRWPGWW